MLRPGGDEVDPGGLYVGVPQHVGQLDHVPAHFIEGPGEQVPQVVGKDLAGGHPGMAAQVFHLRPDLAAGQALSASGEKNLTGGGFLRPGVLFQLPAQLARQQNGAQLALQGDIRLPGPGGLYGDIPHFAHPDARGADGLQQQSQPFPAQGVGGVQQPLVLLPGQLPPVVPEQLPLELQGLDFTVLPAQEGEKLIGRRRHGVDGDRGTALLQQRVPPGGGPLPGDLRPTQKGGQGPDVPHIFFDGPGAALLLF